MRTRRVRIADDNRDNSDEDVRDYVMDMIEQLARLAREAGETDVAIHLSAILESARTGGTRRPR